MQEKYGEKPDGQNLQDHHCERQKVIDSFERHGLCRQRTVGLLRKFLERTLTRQNAAIGEYPRRIIIDALLFAHRKLTGAVGRGALDIRKELRCRAKHTLGGLAVRAPKCAIKDGAAVLDALREGIELIRPRRYHK